MKVFVQIPCLNEEATLPLVIKSIPKKIAGVDSLEILIINDGCTDRTIEIAKELGVKHFVHHRRNRGLARSFRDGIEYALAHGADIVVNTDGDNQYPQAKISELITPILDNKADIVIADRQTSKIEHFSPTKKRLQRIGTKVVNIAADTDIPDAAIGFRSYSRAALLQLNIVTRFSYAMETVIQAGHKQLAIASIPIEVNPKTRESRLFGSMWMHVLQSGIVISRLAVMYRPYLVFNTLGFVLLAAGLTPFVRYLILSMLHNHGNHLQSLIVGAILLIGSFLSFVLSVLADLIRINRVLTEETIEQIKRQRFDS
jgi:glycosyltransferase involved in cell wall biosynthesis